MNVGVVRDFMGMVVLRKDTNARLIDWAGDLDVNQVYSEKASFIMPANDVTVWFGAYHWVG